LRDREDDAPGAVDIQEILRKVRLIELYTRKMVNEIFAGRYNSAFKGTGMEFSDVRLYQPGDDYRSIDWNVTSRTGEVHVKQFKEEREMTIVFAADVSPSMRFGTLGKLKSEVAAEVCALLAFSAIRNQDRVGLYLFSDGPELFIPPKKGKEHVLRIIRDILYFQPSGRGTDVQESLSALSGLLPRRATVFLCSDFLSLPGSGLGVFSRRHDLTALWVEDPAERRLPDTGWMELQDPETRSTIWANLSARATRRRFAAARDGQRSKVLKTLRTSGADLIRVSSAEDIIMPLVRYFRERAARKAS